MSRKTFSIALVLTLFPLTALAQTSTLTIPGIMQDHRTWVGAWPQNQFWSESGEWLYFLWNPRGQFEADSLFKVARGGGLPVKVEPEERRTLGPRFTGWQHGTHTYDRDFRRKVYAQEGDIFVHDRRTGTTPRLTRTTDRAANPRFTPDGSAVVYERANNLYRHELASGATVQLTDLRSGNEPREANRTDQAEWLHRQQEELFDYVREQRRRRALREEEQRRDQAARNLPQTYRYGNRNVGQLQIDPTERFVTFTLSESGSATNTAVPAWITDSGYVEDLNARPKVGAPAGRIEFFVQDLQRDTTYRVNLHQVPGAFDVVPFHRRDEGVQPDTSKTRRDLVPARLEWSGDGSYAVLQIRSRDNKDRWITRLDAATGSLTVLDRQTDEAWIGGPGIGWIGGSGTSGFLPDNRTYFFQSEETGFSLLYTVDVSNGRRQQLTSGRFEVFDPQISRDGRSWYFTSSEGSPYERHFYRMPIGGGERTRLTTMVGNNGVALNPDEATMGMIFSYSNRPPEVYLQSIGRSGPGEPRRITTSPTEQWLAYPWRDQEIIHIRASDGIDVPAHIYRPENPNGAAVFFVHGAGYLQNVHRWWSQYFREYMFHNMLTDLGYTVLDLDFRASAGHGRDFRTAIYRHMGGRDLQDYVDASRWVNQELGIDPGRVFIYGGSYGGFITLMALFTEPQHFGGGAALRAVTDWAHYNHGYTANILNTPVQDSLAFAMSSPINFAEGLEDPLLITHGLVDVNVQVQDVIRLAQRLIELGKEDWELAVYPVEDHGFTEPASWTDQYRRIFRMIEDSVGPQRRTGPIR
jgi:dipeptidyl aminopeptidase/acylaminoacyl peptidase